MKSFSFGHSLHSAILSNIDPYGNDEATGLEVIALYYNKSA